MSEASTPSHKSTQSVTITRPSPSPSTTSPPATTLETAYLLQASKKIYRTRVIPAQPEGEVRLLQPSFFELPARQESDKRSSPPVPSGSPRVETDIDNTDHLHLPSSPFLCQPSSLVPQQDKTLRAHESQQPDLVASDTCTPTPSGQQVIMSAFSMNLYPFTGDGDQDPGDWTVICRVVASQAAASVPEPHQDATKVAIMKRYLSGDALDWYHTYEDQKNFEDTLAAIMIQFPKRDPEVDDGFRLAMQDLMTLRQGFRESVTDYTKRSKKIFARLTTGTAGMSHMDSTITDQYLKGLKDQQFSQTIRIHLALTRRSGAVSSFKDVALAVTSGAIVTTQPQKEVEKMSQAELEHNRKLERSKIMASTMRRELATMLRESFGLDNTKSQH